MVKKINPIRLALTLWLTAFLPLFFAGIAHAQTLTAEVDRTAIGMNETVNLRLRYEGAQAQSDPDLSTLSSQFDILSNQKSSQHSIVNGRVSLSTEWSMILAPRSAGQVLIPPFQVDGATSKPITLLVSKAANRNSSGKEDVFVDVTVDKPEVYVNEQFLVTFTLYFNQTVDSLDKPELQLPNARLEALESVNYQKTLDNTRYGVAEYRYAVFADSTGSVEIPSQTWTVRTTDAPNVGRFGMGLGRVKLYRPQTDSLSVTIKPKPDTYPANAAWLPAEDVTISQQWSRPPSELKVGEPITWSIEINSRGASSEQIPPILEHLQPNGYKTYPDQPTHSTTLDRRGVQGTRTESVALVPTQAGELSLPPVELTWWDTKSDSVKVARLPAKTVFVGAGAPGSAQAPQTASPATAPTNSEQTPAARTEYKVSPVLLALTILLACTNLALAFLLWRARHRASTKASGVSSEPTKPSSRALKQLLKDCQNAEPAQLRQSLLQWAQTQWPGEHHLTLYSLAEKHPQPAFAEALKALDASLYGAGETEIDRAALAEGVQALARQRSEGHQKDNLPPLYATR